MNVFNYIAEAGLSGVGLLTWYVFRQDQRIQRLEAAVESLQKDEKLLRMLEGANQKPKP